MKATVQAYSHSEEMVQMQALTGTVVLDLSWLFPGPYCTSLLHSMGAEVWKIERPGGSDFVRSIPEFFANLNWGKKSVTLDLGRDGGNAIFRQLVKEVDVVVEGFRPGVVERLGVDYETVRAINPRAIYCSISGFGQDGPYRNAPGHDVNYLAVSGVLSVYARHGAPNAGLALPLGDLTSGLFAAFGILGALLEREKTGHGRYLDISMTDGLFSWAALWDLWDAPSDAPRSHPGAEIPHYGVFEARDGRLFAMGLVYESHLWRNLTAATGLSRWADFDYPARLRQRDEIAAELHRVFREKDRDDWLRILEAADVPVSPVNTVPEAANDPQVVFRRLASSAVGPGGQSFPLIRNPVLPRTAVTGEEGPPEPGAHTVEVLQRAGYDSAEIDQLREAGLI